MYRCMNETLLTNKDYRTLVEEKIINEDGKEGQKIIKDYTRSLTKVQPIIRDHRRIERAIAANRKSLKKNDAEFEKSKHSQIFRKREIKKHNKLLEAEFKRLENEINTIKEAIEKLTGLEKQIYLSIENKTTRVQNQL